MAHRIKVQDGIVIIEAADTTYQAKVTISGQLTVANQFTASAQFINRSVSYPDGTVTPIRGMYLGASASNTLQFYPFTFATTSQDDLSESALNSLYPAIQPGQRVVGPTVIYENIATGTWRKLGSGGGGGGGSSFAPYFIPDFDTFVVPENEQALFVMPIDIDGTAVLEIDGYLIELDVEPYVPPTPDTVYYDDTVILVNMTATVSSDTDVAVWYAPEDGEFVDIWTGIGTPATVGTVNVDVNDGVGSSILTTLPGIQATEYTSLTGVPAVIAVTSFSKGDRFTFDIDATGSDATGLQVIIKYTLD